MLKDLVVTLDKVHFSYSKEKAVLTNISLTIPKGKIVAILGTSGSGKTTILRLISGQLKPQRGKVEVMGQDMGKISNSKLNALRRKLGVMFQFGALFTDLSVYDNIAFILNEHYNNVPKSIVNKLVSMKLHSVGLFGTENLFPADLSGGMARRVAMARAMAIDPEVMLYDEPFTGLDPITLNTIAALIKQLSRSLGQTSVLVTHDVSTALEIADLIYLMFGGEIVAFGSPELIKQNQDERVQQALNGYTDGPIKFSYGTKLNYHDYLSSI